MDINGKWNVYKRSPAGKVDRVTPDNGRYYLSCIRQDGKYAVCQGGAFGEHLRIWKVNLNTRDLVPISPVNRTGWAPSYSWDGATVVFSSEKAFLETTIRDMPTFYTPQDTIPMSICSINDDGTEFKQYTSGEYMDIRPTYSPDKKNIAFISKRTGTMKLYEIDTAKEQAPQLIEADYTWAMRPWYTPDNKEIVFHTEIDKKHTLVRYDRITGNIKPMKNDNKGQTHGAFVLKSGTIVLAHSDRGGYPGIWEFPMDGSEPTEIVIKERKICAHATMSTDGTVIFDSPDESLSKVR